MVKSTLPGLNENRINLQAEKNSCPHLVGLAISVKKKNFFFEMPVARSHLPFSKSIFLETLGKQCGPQTYLGETPTHSE